MGQSLSPWEKLDRHMFDVKRGGGYAASPDRLNSPFSRAPLMAKEQRLEHLPARSTPAAVTAIAKKLWLPILTICLIKRKPPDGTGSVQRLR